MDWNRMKALLLSFLVAASAVAQENTLPTASLVLPKSVQASTQIMVKVKLTFAEGLHGYQNPPVGEYEVPVTIVSADKSIAIKQIKYPKGTLHGQSKVYEGTVEIPVLLTLSGKPGDKVVKLKVNYQQCYEGGCFPPSTVVASGKTKLTAKKGG